MRVRIVAVFGVAMALSLMVAQGQAAGLPVIQSAAVDYAHNTLIVTGQNFGTSPTITLNNVTFPTVSSASNLIVANFPSGSTPSGYAPGTYFLVVQYRNQLPSLFSVAIGATGPQGAPGVAGPPGPMGIQGLPGATGATGAMGPPGPIGPAGATGTAGATGATGATGAAGPIGPAGPPGPQGAQGIQGIQGPPGSGSGSGASCPAGTTPVSVTGANGITYQVCGDGTLVDTSTGLMWELKDTACASGDLHCVDSTYTWSGASYCYSGCGPNTNIQDGTLFSVFLATLNDDIDSGGNNSCFANHCDWRIPKMTELLGILSATYPNCTATPCIDPAFGPTATAGRSYWSSSSSAASPSTAWLVYFDRGAFTNDVKYAGAYARAVRGGR